MDETLQPHLDRIAGIAADEHAIHRAFFAEARRFADERLSDAVRRIVGPTAVANAALHSALRAARRANDPMPADEFRTLLLTITRRKAAAAARHAFAEKRDAGRSQSLTGAEAAPNGLSPLGAAIVRELAERVTAAVLAEPDDTRRVICFLGLIQQMPSDQIHTVLAGLARTHPDLGFRVPVLRTIQLELQHARTSLAGQIESD